MESERHGDWGCHFGGTGVKTCWWVGQQIGGEESQRENEIVLGVWTE